MRERSSFSSIPSLAPFPLICRRHVIKTFPEKTFLNNLVSLSTNDLNNCVSVAYPDSYPVARDETVALWLCKDGKSRQDWRSWSIALVSLTLSPPPPIWVALCPPAVAPSPPSRPPPRVEFLRRQPRGHHRALQQGRVKKTSRPCPSLFIASPPSWSPSSPFLPPSCIGRAIETSLAPPSLFMYTHPLLTPGPRCLSAPRSALNLGAGTVMAATDGPSSRAARAGAGVRGAARKNKLKRAHCALSRRGRLSPHGRFF